MKERSTARRRRTQQIFPARRTISSQRWINHCQANLSPRHKPSHTVARSNINPRRTAVRMQPAKAVEAAADGQRGFYFYPQAYQPEAAQPIVLHDELTRGVRLH